MSARRSLVSVATFGVVLSVYISLSAGLTSAQVGPPVADISSLLGSWSLNRELTGVTPAPDVPTRRGGGRGGGGGRGIGGGGFGGGFGGGRGGGGQAGQGRAEAREDAERLVALVQELITPSTRWLIARDAGETLAFTNADGRTVRYAPNGKSEKHQLTNGTIETKSKWNKGELRQEIVASGGIEIVRTFSVDAATQQLIVTTTLDGGGRGGQQRPFRVVYDRDDI